MKKNQLSMIIGFLLLIIFGVLLFMYQVRVTEVAVRTRFGKVIKSIDEPGVGFKLPWPIERIQKFDNRIQNFEDKLEETATQDGRNLLVMTYLGWSIADPAIFRDRVKEGAVSEAERNLLSILRSAKNEVIGKHPFSHFINPDATQLKFNEIERQIFDLVAPQAQSTYGIEVHFLGIKRMNLPDNITQKVFDRMRAERQKLVATYQSQGESAATNIVTEANRIRDEKLAAAEATAKRIRGQADAAAAEYYAVFNQEPEFAKLLLKYGAAEKALGGRATLILDPRTSPLDVLLPPANKPAGNR